ncbi:MAG TPA: ABC transporter permease [Pseudogracilibacillus sp.]|nr:ABC transporter permease [Pseudogracilibacillus sp.]
MNKFFLVMWHTFWTRFKSKAFIISTAITLLVIFSLTNIDKIIEAFTGDEKEMIVLDDTDSTYEMVEASLKDIDHVSFELFEKPLDEGKRLVEEGEYDGFLHFVKEDDRFPNVYFYTEKGGISTVEMTIEQVLQQFKTMAATEEAGVNEEQLALINEPLQFEKIALSEGAKSEEEMNQARGIVYVMLFVLYMAIIIYGQMIASDVAVEKSSRVMEILISSAPPTTHMFAKIIGIALLGLSQMIIIVVFGFTLLRNKFEVIPDEVMTEFGFGDLSFSLYIYALVFFILGYLLYATIAAMLGSLVSRVEDVQQLIFPLIMLIIIAFMIAMVGLSMPEAKFITITSFIPFFAPMIMFLRVGMINVPIWEVALSISILILTIIILGWLAARVYRGGVLLYGPSRSLKDFKQALQLSKKEK